MTIKKPGPDITAETRIGGLLDAFPQLEEVLVALSPAFKKLQNPLLRKTLAKTTSLRHASRVANIELAKLVNTLRMAVGQAEIVIDGADGGQTSCEEAPNWLKDGVITRTLDARPLIESGNMEAVLAHLEQLGDVAGEVFELVTPFVPAPLIDIAKRKGFAAWHLRETDELTKTYFTRIRK